VPLQDQTLAHGSASRASSKRSATSSSPSRSASWYCSTANVVFSALVARAFSAEISGDTEIAFAGRGDLIEVASSPSVPFDSTFSGNTVQICPVGALTAKPYRFSARPWDLETGRKYLYDVRFRVPRCGAVFGQSSDTRAWRR